MWSWLQAPSAAEAERQREQREQREDVQADWQRVSSMILPQRVSRPSWLASADPKAGGDRLKQRLQLADARYEHMYFEQRKIQQQQQQQQQHAGWSLNVGTLSVKDMAFTQVGGEEEEGGGAGVRGLRPDQGAGATKEPPKHLTRKTWHVMSFNQAAPLQQRVSPMRGVPVEPEIQTQSPMKPPSEDEQTLCTDAEGGEPEVAHCEREVSPPLRSPPPAREQERVRQLVETLLVAPRARALAAAAASDAHMSHAPASSLRSLPANERMVEGEERQLINEVNAILDQAPALASATAGTAGGSEVMERLVAHIVRREEQLLEALRLSAASDQRVRAAESELERVRGDNTSLSGQAARLSAVENELSSRLAFAHQVAFSAPPQICLHFCTHTRARAHSSHNLSLTRHTGASSPGTRAGKGETAAAGPVAPVCARRSPARHGGARGRPRAADGGQGGAVGIREGDGGTRGAARGGDRQPGGSATRPHAAAAGPRCLGRTARRRRDPAQRRAA